SLLYSARGSCMKRRFGLWTAALLALLPAAAGAQAIGRITSARGTVSIDRNGADVPFQADLEVQMGDVVKTGSLSRARITFADGTVLNLGDDTRVRLTRLVFDPTSG